MKKTLMEIRREIEAINSLIAREYAIEENLITWKTLSTAELFKPIDIYSGLIVFPVYMSSEKIIFMLLGEKGAESILHYHDCYEEIRVLLGEALETETKRVLVTGSTILIKPMAPHKIVLSDKSMMHITVTPIKDL